MKRAKLATLSIKINTSYILHSRMHVDQLSAIDREFKVICNTAKVMEANLKKMSPFFVTLLLGAGLNSMIGVLVMMVAWPGHSKIEHSCFKLKTSKIPAELVVMSMSGICAGQAGVSRRKVAEGYCSG